MLCLRIDEGTFVFELILKDLGSIAKPTTVTAQRSRAAVPRPSQTFLCQLKVEGRLYRRIGGHPSRAGLTVDYLASPTLDQFEASIEADPIYVDYAGRSSVTPFTTSEFDSAILAGVLTPMVGPARVMVTHLITDPVDSNWSCFRDVAETTIRAIATYMRTNGDERAVKTEITRALRAKP